MQKLRAPNLFNLRREHKISIEKHIGQELLISSVATNTVLDRIVGEGRLIAHETLRNDNQMVRMTHEQLLLLTMSLVSGPLSAATVATT
jgi:hypothetical protein